MSTRDGGMWRGIGSMLAVAVLVAGCGGGGNQDGASTSSAAASDVLQKAPESQASAFNASPRASGDAQGGSEAPTTAATPDLILLGLPGSVVNATTAGDQQSPRIAPLAGGGYVVAWSSGSSNSVQRYDAQGQKVGGEQSIGSGGAITGLLNGGYMVGYATQGRELTPYYVDNWSAVSVRTYTADGGFLTERTLDSVHSIWNYPFYWSQRPPDRLLTGPSFLYLADGGLAVWKGESFYSNNTYRAAKMLQRYDGAGSSVGPREIIGGSIRITPMGHGGYLLGNQIFDRTGTYRGDLPSDLQSVPVAIDSMGDGGYAVAWVSQNNLYAQRLTANGSMVGGSTSVGPVAAANSYYQVLALSDNSFVVIWAPTDAVLQARRFDANGNPAGDVLPIEPPVPYTTSAERGVAVAPLSDGGFAVAWTVTSPGGGADVYTQRFVETRPYTFVGFLRPVKNPGDVNTGRAGRVYPLKWQLKNGNGAFVSSLEAVRSITYKSAQCGSFETALTDGLNAESAGKSTLTYDAVANEYHYNWATPSGPGCYILFLSLDTGQVEQAYFDLR